MQLARLVDRVARIFGERNLTDEVFLDVAKAFYTVWIKGLLYNLTTLNFPSYLVHVISSYLRVWTFEASFLTATSSRRGMRAGVVQCGLISPVLFCLYVNDIPTPSRHVDVALYADVTVIKATSPSRRCSAASWHHHSSLQRWLKEWRIVINVSRSSAIIFARSVRRFIQTQPLTPFGEPIKWLDNTRFLGVTVDKQHTWSSHIDLVRRIAQRMSLLGPILNRSDPFISNGVLLYNQLVRNMMEYACSAQRFCARTHVGMLQVLQSKCLRPVTGAPCYLSKRQIH